jgi:ABC-2 type transport system permease protein
VGSGGLTFRALGAFARRDFQVYASYRIPFVLDVVSSVFIVLTFFYVSQIVPPGEVEGGYLTFVMVGLALTAFLEGGMTILAGNVRLEQIQGTLEATVATGIPTPILAAGLSAYPLAASGVRAVTYVLLAAAVGARAPGANWGLAMTATVLGSVSFAGVGLVAAALVLVIRQVAAATAWLASFLTLAAGALFPPRLLPDWADTVAALSPFTHALRLAREAILEGASWSESWGSLMLLGALAVAFAAFGVGALAMSLRWARRRGALARY